ncbi:MAG: trigger factor, partial [Bacteriovoracales bacterium]|nr:trigger factor [Bacteriovoracales bacterium]
MPYTVENTNDYTKKFQFHFEGLDTSPAVEKALKEKQKTAQMKGFRKGKVPLSLIKNLYGPAAEEKAVHSMVSTELAQALQKENLRPLGSPELKDLKYEEGLIKAFEAHVQYLPPFEVKDFSHLSFTQRPVSISEEEFQNEIKRHLEPHGQMKTIEDKNATLSEGQFAVINYRGIDENENPIESLKGEEYLVEIGPHTFGIPEGGQAMEGMKVGDKRDVTLGPPKTSSDDP